jgi:hypothetical protein
MELIILLVLIVMPIIWLINKIIGNSRTLLIKRLKKGHSGIFSYASKKNKDDLEIVKIAVQCGSYNFEYASERIRSDENIVLDFIDIAPEIIRYSLIKTDKIFQKALSKDGSLIIYCPYSYRSNRDIVNSALFNININLLEENRINETLILRHLSNELKNDRNIVLSLVKIDPYNLTDALDNFKNDREIVKEALIKDGNLLEHASDTLKDDLDFVKIALNNAYFISWDDKSVLASASERLRNDRELVKIAITKNGGYLKHASILLRKDYELCKLAIKNDYHSFQFTSESLKNDLDFVIEALNINSNIAQYLSEEIKNNSTIIKKIQP